MNFRKLLLASKLLRLLVLPLALASAQRATAQVSTFTYQGRLNDAGSPANGTNYGMVFSLYNAATGGTALGTQNVPSVSVTNGLFAVPLDFGNAFDGSSRWLEIAVQKDGGPFTTLAPRQSISPTPQAMFARSASNLVGSLPASQLTGPLPTASLPTNVARLDAIQFFTNINYFSTNIYVNGPVHLGAGGTQYAAAGPENLRIIRGAVHASNTALSIMSGVGFSVTRASAGIYLIQLSAPFSTVPSVVATAYAGSAHWAGVGTSQFQVYITNPAGTAYVEDDFNFIAIGSQ